MAVVIVVLIVAVNVFPSDVVAGSVLGGSGVMADNLRDLWWRLWQ
jgi:hypothetical protein